MKSNTTIECPECGANFSVNDFIEKQINKQLEVKENELKQKESLLTSREKDFNQKVEDAIRLKQKDIFEKAKKEVETKFSLEMKDKDGELIETKKKLEISKKAELELRKREREVEDKEKSMELEIQRKASELNKTSRAEISKEVEEKYLLKLAEKEKQIDQMKKQASDLSRKSQEGSQQLQGETAEETFENILRSEFANDEFEEILKGVNGGDLIQTVKNESLKECGKILWEFKDTKTYKKEWISKLKGDRQKANAEVAILATRTLPKDSKSFELVDGICIVKLDKDWSVACCKLLRTYLINLDQNHLATINKDKKMELLYFYLNGPQFKQKFEDIINSYKEQKNLLEKEKRSLSSIWKKRDKQLDIVIDSATGIYGDVQGIIDSKNFKFDELELPDDSKVVEIENKNKN